MAVDPTRSKTKRDRWNRDFNNRWQRVERRLESRILNDSTLDPTNDDVPISYQTADFRDFYLTVLEEEILSPMESRHVRRGSHYTGRQVRDFYEHGIELADTKLSQAGYDVPDVTAAEVLRRERTNPGIHQEHLEEEYLETYYDLEGVTNDTLSESTTMYQHAVRGSIAAIVAGTALTASELEDESGSVPPPTLVKMLKDRMSATGKNRTDLVAQAKSIETINDASLNRYFEMGVEEVGVDVEIRMEEEPSAQFATAGDDRVCLDCQRYEDNLYPIEAIRGNLNVNYDVPHIPLHPRCRCYWVPAMS